MIASEMPGLFDIDRLEAMDYRDLIFWSNEARKIRLHREATAINSARYAQAERDDYIDRMSQIEWELTFLNNPEATGEEER
ncbi:MAG: hypothetical protein M0R66_06295 [Candidatus Omnitrophica bacterium]|nr:hypothetical protein [Candidatus Omnitrophota bacterium]OPZ34842.1 MAG: hypothetical protein BWY96_02999 [Spirochaetes bacterium ADurb.BinA120]